MSPDAGMRFNDFALIAAEAAALALVGCGEAAEPKSSAIALEGRLERGSVVQVVATEEGQQVDPASLQLTFSPDDGATTLAGGSVRLRKAGALTINARFPDQSQVTLAIDVATPPWIVFDMSADGNRDIYKVALDGAELTRLTSDPGDDSDPVVGTTGPIVFVSRRNGNAELYSMPRDGGAETRLTISSANETQPAISADGSTLAFTRDDAGVGRVWTSTAAAASQRAVTQSFGTSGTVEVGPSLSAHGDSVIFTATAEGNANLYSTRTSTTTAPVRLLPISFDSVRVESAWSRDGKRIAFIGAGADASQLFTYDLQSHGIAKLTSGSQSVGQPFWLSDGRLVFTRFASGQTSLCWIDPASPSTITLIPVPGTDPQHPSGASE